MIKIQSKIPIEKNLTKWTRIGSKSISKSQLGLGPGYKSTYSSETSLTSRQEFKMGLKTSKF
jgi:hypothetical protein